MICRFFVIFKHDKLKNAQVISPFWEPALMRTLLNQTCILNSVHKFLRTQAILSGLFLLYAVHTRTWIYDICSNDFFFSKTKSISVIGTWLTDFIGHKFIYFIYFLSIYQVLHSISFLPLPCSLPPTPQKMLNSCFFIILYWLIFKQRYLVWSCFDAQIVISCIDVIKDIALTKAVYYVYLEKLYIQHMQVIWKIQPIQVNSMQIWLLLKE